MADKQDNLIQIGAFQLVLGFALLVVLFLVLRSTDTVDGHQQANADAITTRLDAQTQLLRDLNQEVRRLQDQRRVVDELKEALRSAAPQYVMPAPQAQAPVGTQAPTAQAPTQPTPAAPAPATPAVEAPGAGTAHGAALGVDKKVAGPDPDASIGGTLVEATSEPKTFNLYTTSEGTTRVYMREIIEPLFSISEQDASKLSPRLATSWEALDDKVTYIYHLRKGVRWSDGAPFSADDVVFTYNAMMDPAVEAESARGGFSDVESLTKVDDFTIQVKTKRPYWKTLYQVGYQMNVLPRHWYQRRVSEVATEKKIAPFSVNPGEPGFGACFNQIHEPCVGTGPYMVPEGGWRPGEGLTLERNPTHWRHAVEPGVFNIQTKKVRFISDQLAITNQIRQQKVDIHAIKLDEWQDGLSREPVIKDNYNFYQYDHLGLGYNCIVWNCRKFPFDDRRVRVAMTQLVDRVGMLRDLWRNNGQVATCPSKPIFPEYNKEITAWPFDREAAAALLTEAGFVDHDNDGVREKQVGGEWKPLEFTINLPSGIPEYEKIGNRVKESMESVGVRVTVQSLEWAVFVQRLDDLDFQGACLYYSMSDPWPDNYESYHSTEDKPRGGNTPGLHNDELDKLLAEARTEFDAQKRIPMYHRIYKILHDEQPMTLLVHGRVNVLVHKRFRNVVIRHLGARSTYWWVDPRVASPNN